ARLERAGEVIREMGLNQLQLAPPSTLGEQPRNTQHATRNTQHATRNPQPATRLGIIASGVVASYLDEGFEIAARFGLDPDAVSVLRVVATHPFPAAEVRELLRHCDTILVLEELEPHIERGVIVEAHRLGFGGRIVGKLDGPQSSAVGPRPSAVGPRPSAVGPRLSAVGLDRVGEYGVAQVVHGVGEALGLPIPEDLFQGNGAAEQLAARRPITVCAGCPHRGTYMAINQAIRKLRLKKDEVMVTGDIGCTILGMNPPFHTVWNEVAMGASVSLAQGYVHAGVETPVIATIGDSTFFHAGIPGLVNAVQHQVPLTLIIMDNGWTAMTGMQVNPGTAEPFQPPGGRSVDIARLVPALGVEHFFVIDPFDLGASAATIQEALTLPGVKVVLSRRECAIQAQRRGLKAGKVRVIPENCNLCKLCITRTGCPAIAIGEDAVLIDPALCYGCTLCAQVCNREAIEKEAVP
ncbi:MAG TPA: thiamine pyrophosphate-dependent enzyme, partial [Phycisphaerae bacterium]|nr:thiamine pyrophosphate-dependent enzyme [Phycisphaerae bacterium]